jgi:hypothetical protein
MAIRLASAIGQQREPIGIFGGVDDAINKTGDAIQAANREKRNEEAKKRDAALQAAINIDTNIDAMKDDNEKYKQTANKLVSEVFTLYANGASPMQIAAKKKEAEEILAPMKYRYEKDKEDYSKIQEFVSKEENKGKYDFTEAENFLLGRDTREVPMPMQAPTDRAMPLNKEDSDVTEVMNIQETPYWKKELGERQTQAPSSAYAEFMSRVKDKTGNFSDASKGYFGKDYDPQKQYSKVFTTQNADGTAVQEVRLDTEEIARDKSKFLSSIGTELGDTKTQQYWRTLANKAGTSGKKAGLYGERLNKFVEQAVLAQASTDFDNAVQQDIEKSKIARVDNAPFREGKGMTFNNNLGGGGSETPDGVFIPKETPLLSDDELKSYVKEKDAERYGRWRAEYNKMHENDKEKKEESEIKEIHKRELSKPSKNNPNLTIQQWNEQQARKEADNAKKGLTAISFTPKGKDNWFSAKTNDGVTRKIIPKTIYKNDKGELVKVEGYNVDESTDKVKIDLEEFEVDTKNEANRNSFIGKYPTSIEAAEINMPTKVVVSGKQGVGTIQGKRAATAKKPAPKVGTIKDGYKFIGGEPSNPKNWEKIK